MIEMPAVLIVDDEPDLCEELAYSVRNHGYQVMVAESAPQAKAVMEALPDIVVIVTDIRMPGGDGLQFTRDVLKDRPEEHPLEVILITGHATLDSAIAAVGTGAFDMLRKPIKIADLLASITAAVARATGRRALARERSSWFNRGITPVDGLHSATLVGAMGFNAFAALSHELRTPLVPISGYAELIGNISDSDQIVRYATQISRSCRLLCDTTDLLMHFSRLTALHEMNLRPCRVDALLADVARMYSEHAASLGGAFAIACQPVGPVLADSQYLCVGLLSLARAALTFIPSKGGLLGWCRPEADEVAFGFDGYAGPPPAEAPRELVSASDATKELIQAAPLGLQYCQMLMGALGGSLKIIKSQTIPWRAELRLPQSQAD